MCSVPANMPAKKRNLRFPILKEKTAHLKLTVAGEIPKSCGGHALNNPYMIIYIYMCIYIYIYNYVYIYTYS